MSGVKRIVVTAGEPAGIGPDIVLALASAHCAHQLIICANMDLLRARVAQLGIVVRLKPYDAAITPTAHIQGELWVCDEPLGAPVIAGELNAANSDYVLRCLHRAASGCLSAEFAALITAPIHKGIINQAGIPFTGHTEYLAEIAGNAPVVMMLATEGLRVALATTHLPLAKVPAAITAQSLTQIIRILHHDLQHKFGISDPQIYVCGLNPHAGEGGSLGREEIEIINPTLEQLRLEGISLIGALPADTLFQEKYLSRADAVLAMYHDQGLPVLKFKGFGNSVNITLGLPFIRTSVDHGTALELAGTGSANTGSLWTALSYANDLVNTSA